MFISYCINLVKIPVKNKVEDPINKSCFEDHGALFYIHANFHENVSEISKGVARP